MSSANRCLWNTLRIFRGQADHDARQVGLFTGQALLNAAVGGPPLWLAATFRILPPFVGGNAAKVFSMVVAPTMGSRPLRLFVFPRQED